MTQSIEREMDTLLSASTVDGITSTKLMANADKACSLVAAYESRGYRLKSALGKILLVVQDTKAYADDYQSFEEYRLAMADRFKISRTVISECLRVSRALPNLEADQAERIPSTNLNLVALAVKSDPEMAPGQVTKLLKEAERAPVSTFKESLKERGLLTSSVADPRILISFRVPKTVAAEWKRFVADREPSDALKELLHALHGLNGGNGRKPMGKAA